MPTYPSNRLSQTPRFERYLAVDPGRKGAIAVLNASGALIRLENAGSVEVLGAEAVSQVLREEATHGAVAVAIERPLAFRIDNAASLVTLSLAAGSAYGAAVALGALVEFPTASVWKRSLGVTADKTTSRKRAQELFGDRIPSRCRIDKCEAALMAYWLYRRHQPNKAT
ncbi:hypothetical protein E1N52_27135 [Paraburkholderia guartelaensis]|uniref:Uncharacterized protein n=1 Tax=Paraburkholderia guartelaensis TaxID=2546446 RepID=A0A4R5LA81_9BURK|nr:hypothetical protein [Paraburkholderia guartelaensis]TDG05112.1 hypothetical protein E1N52_27135 [Paraburkholderia guartelaensis]